MKNDDVTPQIVEISKSNYEHKRVHFSPYDFFLYYINIHMVQERERCTP